MVVNVGVVLGFLVVGVVEYVRLDKGFLFMIPLNTL